AARVGAWLGPERALAGAVAAAGLAQLVLGLISDAVAAGSMLALSGAAFTVWNVLNTTVRQSLVPDALLGRANSVYLVLGLGATGLGALCGGAVTDALGLRAPLLLGAPVLAVA